MKQFDDLAKLLINPKGSTPIHICLLYLNDKINNINYSKAFGNIEASDKAVDINSSFRTGSITKTFTATLVLQLMEEGSLDLNDTFLSCLLNPKTKTYFTELLFFNGINYSNQITVKSLLQHKSGLRDYYADNERFVDDIRNIPNHQWDWKKVMNTYFIYNLNEKGVFKPNEGFYYSDTNYLLLAVLIEEITSLSYHTVLENRLLNRLSLNDTYLEFYHDKKGLAPIVYPYHGTHSLKDFNTSFDWGGGGLLSTAKDLDVFLRSLLEGKLFSDKNTLQLMIDFTTDTLKNNISYGMGLQQKEIGGLKFLGHNSAYGGMMFYNIDTNLSIILTINQVLAPHKAEWLMKKVVEDYTFQ